MGRCHQPHSAGAACMSVRVMSLVWAMDLPDSEKIVLLALADCANDEGHCWPGMATLTRKCSKSDRTIQIAIRSLCTKGHLTRREVPGKGCNYTVHPIVRLADPRSCCTPEGTSPRNDLGTPPKPVRDTPEAASGKPSKNHQEPSSSARGAVGVKTLIPADWKAPPVSELPPRSRACAEQWTEDSYQTEAEAFVCYWRSERKMKGDWRDTWCNRIVSRHSAVMRDQKFGNAAPASKQQLSAAQWRERAEFYDRVQRREDAAECRRKAAELERQAA
jgi:hypothetical protein